jgi:hypothetical protein
MAVYKVNNIQPDNISNGTFRAWGSALSAGIANAGWNKYQTNIDWSTVSTPNSTTWQSAGYEVWQTTDSLTPWYLRIDYCLSQFIRCPGLKFQFGTTCDASGVIGGSNSAVFQCAVSWYASAYSTEVIVCGDGSWLTMSLFCSSHANLSNNTDYGIVLNWERLKDSVCADTDLGVYCCTCHYGTTCQQETVLTGSNTGYKTTTNSVEGYGWSCLPPPPLTDNYESTKLTTTENITCGWSSVNPWIQKHYPACLGVVLTHGLITQPDRLYGTNYSFGVKRADGLYHVYMPVYLSANIHNTSPHCWAAIRYE